MERPLVESSFAGSAASAAHALSRLANASCANSISVRVNPRFPLCLKHPFATAKRPTHFTHTYLI